MTVLRSLVFQVLFYGWTFVLGVVLLPTLVLPHRFIVAGGRLWLRSELWLLAATVGLTFRVAGRENIPDGPAIFAAKHQSAWDTLALPMLVRDPAIVVKRELLSIPFYGWYARKHGMIAIDRARGYSALKAILAEARRAVEMGKSVIVFPEGTRTTPGVRRPYHPGVAALYAGLDLPVVPVALNSGLFWGRRSFTKRPGCITVEFLPPIAPGLERRAFMERLETAIETASAALASAAQRAAA